MQQWKGVVGRGRKSDCHLQAHRWPAGGACCLFSTSVATAAVSELQLHASPPRRTVCRETKNGKAPGVLTAYSQSCPLVPANVLFAYEQGCLGRGKK